MIWMSRIGIGLISLFLLIALAVKPSEFLTVLFFFGLVAYLGVWAEVARLERLGKIGPRGRYATSLAAGILATIATVISLAKETYFMAAFYAFAAVVLLFLGVWRLFLAPKRASGANAQENSAGSSR